jgi:hypothetical protein
MIVWAGLASAFGGYYYLQNSYNAEQFESAQESLNRVALDYGEAASKYDSLSSEYGSLYANYSGFMNSDYTTLMPLLGNLISDFVQNYTTVFSQVDTNESYNQLLGNYQKLLQKGNVTKTDFGNLLSEFQDVFNLSVLRQLGLSISEATTLSVNVEFDYGNGTVEWRNETNVSAGLTLFELTREIAVIQYSYYAYTEPGHVLVDSINNKTAFTNPSYTEGYTWIWYSWSNSNNKWIPGPVGCDAWLLENGSSYRWNYEQWTYP